MYRILLLGSVLLISSYVMSQPVKISAVNGDKDNITIDSKNAALLIHNGAMPESKLSSSQAELQEWTSLTDYFIEFIEMECSTPDFSEGESQKELLVSASIYIERLFELKEDTYKDLILSISNATLRYFPEEETFLIYKARVYIARKAYDSAISILDTIQNLNPMNTTAIALLAQCYAGLEKTVVAKAYFQKLMLYGDDSERQSATEAMDRL